MRTVVVTLWVALAASAPVEAAGAASGPAAGGSAASAPAGAARRSPVASALAWRSPVAGAVARPFHYVRAAPFRAGAHRGVDLAARPGAVARAVCSGIVATASQRVVTLRCGPWRVTALPIASFAARVGERVRAGTAIGRVGTMPGHTGLHVGVRRASDPFGYVDPESLLEAAGRRPPLAPIPREGPRPIGARPVGPEPTAPAALPASAWLAPATPVGAEAEALRAAAPGGVRVSAGGGSGGLAPWPAWVGLGLLLVGAVGGGARIGRRRRVGGLAEAAVEGVPSAS